jgi:hypothetical protein
MRGNRHNHARCKNLSCAMPMKRTRPSMRGRPARETFVWHGDRIAKVLGEARGQRVMIKSIHRDGVERRSAVKWTNLLPLDDQLF